MQNSTLAQVDISSWKFPLTESSGEIFSSPREDYQMVYKLKKKIELRTKNNGTER